MGWLYDVAREQSPTAAGLAELLARSAGAGYTALGLYLEHRCAWPAAPWAAGPGALTPEAIARVQRARPAGVRLIPFLNTLGHMEGFVRAEGGQWLAEGPAGFGSTQLCPSRPECVAFARDLVADALALFDDEWLHLGGDETRQLGQCPRCAARAAAIGPAGIYAEHYAPLCRWVLARGRRPGLWGDMLLAHPAALDALPRQTLIFDWQYDHGPHESTRLFRERGFDVVCCPAIHTFDSGWCHLAATRQNIAAHAAEARAGGALGVLVTSWELSFFTNYGSVLPILFAAGRVLAGADGAAASADTWRAALVQEGGPEYTRAAELIGEHVPAAAAFLRPGTWRQLRDRLAIRQDPFALWRDWREEACGPAGDAVLRLCAEAGSLLAPEHPLQGAVELHRVAVEWVRSAERAARHYADGRLGECAAELERGSELLARLRPHLARAAAAGGSTADLGRLDRIVARVAQAARRVRELPVSTFRPAYGTLVHDAYIPGDQAAWMTAG